MTHPFGELSALRQRIGAALRRLRTDAKLSGADIAERTGISQSAVSRIELGQQAIPVAVVQRWVNATGADEAVASDLLDLADSATTEAIAWRKAMSRGLVKLQEDSKQLESVASTILNFQSMRIPGLLQVPGYARRVFEADHSPGSPDLVNAVAARMNRQAILYDETKNIELLISEVAFRWPIGPDDMMRAQIDRVIAATSLTSVKIGIIPIGSEITAWHDHGFNVIDHTDGTSVVHVETLTSGLTITDPADISRYREVFAQLRGNAVFGAEARRLLTLIAEQYETDRSGD